MVGAGNGHRQGLTQQLSLFRVGYFLDKIFRAEKQSELNTLLSLL